MKGKTIAAIIVALALIGGISSCTKEEANSYDGKCDNCGRPAKYGGNGNTEYCSSCFESFVDYVFSD